MCVFVCFVYLKTTKKARETLKRPRFPHLLHLCPLLPLEWHLGVTCLETIPHTQRLPQQHHTLSAGRVHKVSPNLKLAYVVICQTLPS